MYKFAVILFLLVDLLFIGNCFGQDPKVKSKAMKESYKSLYSRSSTDKASLLLKEADELKLTSPGEALNKVEEALAMSIAKEDDFGEGKCYLLLGEINEGIEEWKLALENYSRSYQKLTAEYAATPEYKRVLQGIGAMNLKLGNSEGALKYFQEGLSLDLNLSERSERLLNISEVYYQMGDYEQARRVLAQIPSSGLANSSLNTRLENQRARIQARTNNLTPMKNIYENSTNSIRSGKKVDAEEEKSLQDTKEDIAGVLKEQKRYNDEIGIRQQAIDYNLENKNVAEVANDKVKISNTLETKGNNAAALKELEEAALIADTIDNPKAQANAYLALAGSYEKNGRPAKALATYRKYSEAVARNEKQSETRLTEKSELIKKQKDIEGLTKDVSLGQREETIQQQTVFRQQLIIFGLLLIIAIIGTTSYFIYKNAKASKLANQMLALKSLRSQMNPHFIFNALNSVNHFIAQQDERTANKFLSEFSQLMRLVLENSQEDFIPLQKEQEILSLYLKLEHYRFRDKFDYEMDFDKEINTEVIDVPPMLIQPYIENAIWHGLRYKDSMGKLLVRFRMHEGNLMVEIRDNGIGRQKSAELKTENQKMHNSTGLKNIRERLAILNKVYKADFRVYVEDPVEGSGTLVKIYIPLNNRMNGK